MAQQQLVNTFNTLHLPGNIRSLRKSLNLSQDDFGKRVGLNRGNIASYENGTAEPKICSLIKIADLHQISMIDLVLRDLTDTQNYKLATTNFKQKSNRDKSVIEDQDLFSQEIENVIKSLHNCHLFKMKTMKEDTPREVEAMAHKFEELYQVTQALLKHHNELLSFVQCRLEHKGNC